MSVHLLAVPTAPVPRLAHFALRTFSFTVGVLGVALVLEGGQMALNGGSWYYWLAGGAFLVSASMIWRGRRAGAWILFAFFCVTLTWALWEVGFEFWPLVSRLVLPAIIAALALLLAPFLGGPIGAKGWARAALGGAGAIILALLATLSAALVPHGQFAQAASEHRPGPTSGSAAAWTHNVAYALPKAH